MEKNPLMSSFSIRQYFWEYKNEKKTHTYIYIYSFSIRQYFWEYISEKVVKSWNFKFSKVFWRLLLPRELQVYLWFPDFFFALPLQFLFLAFSFSRLCAENSNLDYTWVWNWSETRIATQLSTRIHPSIQPLGYIFLFGTSTAVIRH